MIRPLLTEAGCLRRQALLREAMERSGWDLFLTGNPRTIYTFTAALVPLEQPALLLADTRGGSLLLAPAAAGAFVTEIADVPVYSPVRPVVSPILDAASMLRARLPDGRQRMGVELASTPAAALAGLGERVTVEDATLAVLELRRTKQEDEGAEIRRGLALNAIAYDAARRTIRPGLSELELHTAMSLAVAGELGTAIPLAGDFACGMRSLKEGGAPVSRVIRQGELCVLDLFIAPAYYFGDTCRTFCAGTPDAAQLEAWRLVRDVLLRTSETLRPGVRAAEFYEGVRAALDAGPVARGTFWHHAGHGIGCQGHEAPRLIPESPDVVREGDIIAVEPAVYVEALRGGLRLENTFQVGAAGAVSLFDYPLDLDLL